MSTYEKTLYFRHMNLRKWIASVPKGPSAVLDHGANPGMFIFYRTEFLGLISHFVKQGLVDIAKKLIVDKKAPEGFETLLKESIAKNNFGELARIMGVKVIHCSERDTQLTDKPKKPKEFVNTWSVEGFYEEGIAPSEMGWGTHEQSKINLCSNNAPELPKYAVLPPVGPKNQIFVESSGIDIMVRSFVPPDHEIIGMVVRHGEAFSISGKWYFMYSLHSQNVLQFGRMEILFIDQLYTMHTCLVILQSLLFRN